MKTQALAKSKRSKGFLSLQYLFTGMTDITFTPTISIDAIIAFFALCVASYFAIKQVSIMDQQRRIFDRQREISEGQKFYQGQQTTISKQQADLFSQQLKLLREQETHRKNQDELSLLIAPLYVNFSKNYEIVEWMSFSQQKKIWIHKDNLSRKVALENLESEIIETMRQRKGFAHEPLYTKIDAVEKLLPNLRTPESEIKNLLNEIFELVKTRYNELIVK